VQRQTKLCSIREQESELDGKPFCENGTMIVKPDCLDSSNAHIDAQSKDNCSTHNRLDKRQPLHSGERKAIENVQLIEKARSKAALFKNCERLKAEKVEAKIVELK